MLIIVLTLYFFLAIASNYYTRWIVIAISVGGFKICIVMQKQLLLKKVNNFAL